MSKTRPSAAIQNNFSKYTAVGGTSELRDAIVRRHTADFKSEYRREECMASVGGKHALFNAIQVLVDHGDEVILPVPYWVSFKDIVRYAGGNCVLLEADESQGFRVTAEMISRLVTPRTKMIILNSPSNPSGAVMSPKDLKAVVQLAAERGIWVLSDECYVYLNYTGENFSVGSLREFRERMVIIGSLSKTYAMTGWRLGYALAPAVVLVRHAETAEPIHFEPDVNRAEGGGGCFQRAARLRRGNARRIHKTARPRGQRFTRHPGSEVHHAGGRNLRLSQHRIVHRTRRNQICFRSHQPAGCCVRRMWRRSPARDLASASTFGFRTPLQ